MPAEMALQSLLIRNFMVLKRLHQGQPETLKGNAEGHMEYLPGIKLVQQRFQLRIRQVEWVGKVGFIGRYVVGNPIRLVSLAGQVEDLAE